MITPVSDMFRTIAVTRASGSTRVHRMDHAATEEALEIRLFGKPFAVVMRTPGADRELTAGFLLSEGVVRGAGEIARIKYCSRSAPPERRNVMDVRLKGSAAAGRLVESRRVLTTAACGLCGRTTLESLEIEAPPVVARWSIEPDLVVTLPEQLRDRQSGFHQTGSLHAAGLFDRTGHLVDHAEDVGRHNAVDKVIGGALLRDALPLGAAILAVSGRASFEIVQKAFIAGIPVICAVSGPSTLAIELAERAGITLIAFVRGQTFNMYSHPERVTGSR